MIGWLVKGLSACATRAGAASGTPTAAIAASDRDMLVAHALFSSQPATAPRQAAWYPKTLLTFSDALALVRHYLWIGYPTFRISREEPDVLKIPKPLFDTLVSTLCYAV